MPAVDPNSLPTQTFEWGSAKVFTALTGLKGTALTALTRREIRRDARCWGITPLPAILASSEMAARRGSS